VVALDTPGVVRYPATKSFGNFAWDLQSLDIGPLARSQTCACSVYVGGLFKYRLFFADGTSISGYPIGTKGFWWSVINYGRTILFALHDDSDGLARTFYADDQGWVYEADVGRSLAGDDLPAALVLHPMTQRGPLIEKTYRQGQLEVAATSACTLYTSVQFGGDEDGASAQTSLPQYGSGGLFDLTSFDESYWDAGDTPRKTFPADGDGTSITLTINSQADNELQHTLYSVSLIYTPRKVTS
jgi:hypothetical protein